jgi:hypothetical protein
MIKTLFTAAIVAALAVPALAASPRYLDSPSDDAFNSVVSDINDAVAKIVAAQAKRSRQMSAEVKEGKDAQCTPAQIDAAYADVPRCEAAIKKAFGADLRDFKGELAKGFSRGGYSVVLLTTTDLFVYHEDCDICAAVERCELKTGKVSTFKTAHSVDCSDLAPFLKKGVVYSACPQRP